MRIASSNSRIEIQQGQNPCEKSQLCLRARLQPCRNDSASDGALAPEVRPRKLLHCEAGQAFVELALVLPLLILIIVGAAELGRLAYAAIEVNNAARAGVAYASQSHTTANDTDSIQLAATEEAATQDAADITNITATSSQSCACESTTGAITSFASCDKDTTNLTSCPAPSRIVLYVTVKTSAPINNVFHIPAIPNTITLNGSATMRVLE